MSYRFSVVPNKETCAVWTISPENTRATIVETDAGKSVRIIRSSERTRGGRVGLEFLENLRHIPIVISLDSRLAYTAILPFKIDLQGDPRADRLEFHGILRELVNKANLETRLQAAKALGVEDLDAVLFDARVMNLKMDGKELVGWPQFPGKKLEGSLNAMFTTRKVFHDMQDILHSGREIFVTEEDKAAISILEKLEKGPHRLLHAEPGRTELFTLDYRHETILKKIRLNWSSPLTLIMEEWRLSETAGREVLDMAGRGEVSQAAAKLFRRMVDAAAEDIEKALVKAKMKGAVYLRGSDVLPFELPHSFEGIQLVKFPLSEAWSLLGFGGAPDEALAPILLPILEFFYHRGDPAHHRALSRQIHWIAP